MRHQQFPTGETLELTQAPIRAGATTCRSAKLCAARPRGRTQVTTGERRSTLADAADPLSVRRSPTPFTTNGRTSVLATTPTARKETARPLEVGPRRRPIDAKGHPVRVRPGSGRRRRSPTSTTPAACCGAPRRAPRSYTLGLRRPRPAGGPASTAHGRRDRAHLRRRRPGRRDQAPGRRHRALRVRRRGRPHRGHPPGGQRHVLTRDARGCWRLRRRGGRELRPRPRRRRPADLRRRRRRPHDVHLRYERARRRAPGRAAAPSSTTATTAPLDRPASMTRTPPAAGRPRATRSRSTARRRPASPPPARAGARTPSATTTTGS